MPSSDDEAILPSSFLEAQFVPSPQVRIRKLLALSQ